MRAPPNSSLVMLSLFALPQMMVVSVTADAGLIDFPMAVRCGRRRLGQEVRIGSGGLVRCRAALPCRAGSRAGQPKIIVN